MFFHNPEEIMNIYIKKQRFCLFYRALSAFIAVAFLTTSIVPQGFGLSAVEAYAQSMSVPAPIVLNLPVPGTMVGMTEVFTPAMVKGITIHPDNPLLFDFLINKGDTHLKGDELKTEANKLIKYFLAGLTVPEKEMWVNLSPYEADRIIPEGFGDTEMGRDLLAQDYILKQLTSSLMYPEDELGEAFWQRVYEKSYEKFGHTDIPMNTFNKIWIVPENASVYEHEETSTVYLVDSHLKVMLEEDYVAAQHNSDASLVARDSKKHSDIKRATRHAMPAGRQERLATNLIREILIPEIEREVNQGKTFANLRQIYHSVILATWYKRKFAVGNEHLPAGRQGAQSLLGHVYVDQNKTKGVDTQDKDINQKIYNQYVESFKKGVYDYIKEDYDPATRQIIPRKYFSGGAELFLAKINHAMLTPERRVEITSEGKNTDRVVVELNEIGLKGTDYAQVVTDSGEYLQRAGDIKSAENVDAVISPIVDNAMQTFPGLMNKFSKDGYVLHALERGADLTPWDGEVVMELLGQMTEGREYANGVIYDSGHYRSRSFTYFNMPFLSELSEDIIRFSVDSSHKNPIEVVDTSENFEFFLGENKETQKIEFLAWEWKRRDVSYEEHNISYKGENGKYDVLKISPKQYGNVLSKGFGVEEKPSSNQIAYLGATQLKGKEFKEWNFSNIEETSQGKWGHGSSYSMDYPEFKKDFIHYTQYRNDDVDLMTHVYSIPVIMKDNLSYNMGKNKNSEGFEIRIGRNKNREIEFMLLTAPQKIILRYKNKLGMPKSKVITKAERDQILKDPTIINTIIFNSKKMSKEWVVDEAKEKEFSENTKTRILNNQVIVDEHTKVLKNKRVVEIKENGKKPSNLMPENKKEHEKVMRINKIIEEMKSVVKNHSFRDLYFGPILGRKNIKSFRDYLIAGNIQDIQAIVSGMNPQKAKDKGEKKIFRKYYESPKFSNLATQIKSKAKALIDKLPQIKGKNLEAEINSFREDVLNEIENLDAAMIGNGQDNTTVSAEIKPTIVMIEDKDEPNSSEPDKAMMEKKTILLVEDDEDIRKGLKDFFESRDYNVIAMENGKEALTLIIKRKEMKEPLDLVISDLDMPEMDGMELLENAEKIWPELLFIMQSGRMPSNISGLLERKSNVHKALDKRFALEKYESALNDLWGDVDSAMIRAEEVTGVNKVGGINLDPAMLDLQIKRDGNGVPLPVSEQDFSMMHIEGVLPVIINVTPVNIPMLLGFANDVLPVAGCPSDDEMIDCDRDLISIKPEEEVFL